MPKPQLELAHVSIDYGAKVRAVNDLSLTLQAGDIGCLLGPSGCGKTSVLRAIAGLEPLAEGTISLGGIEVASGRSGLPPEKRRVGMVFQDFALFPHLNVSANIAFGIRRLDKHERQRRVDELLELIGLAEYAKQYPHELSGGQQQRVALARALAPKPAGLLLDEPFSAVDVERREWLARRVREILKETDTTALLVTHDQQEAFAVADRIGVMRDGRLYQWDEAYSLYHRPASTFVADFIGRGTLIKGEVVDRNQVNTELGMLRTEHSELGIKPGTEVAVLVRPDDVTISHEGGLVATIVEEAFKGALRLYRLRTQAGQYLYCYRPSHEPPPEDGRLRVRAAMDHLVVFPLSDEPDVMRLRGPFAT